MYLLILPIHWSPTSPCKKGSPTKVTSHKFNSFQLFIKNKGNVNNVHYYKTRLLQLGFSTSTSEKIRTLLTWKTTSRFRQAVKCGHSHVGQDVPNEHVPNGSEVWSAPVLYFLKSCPTSLHLVNISNIRHMFI